MGSTSHSTRPQRPQGGSKLGMGPGHCFAWGSETGILRFKGFVPPDLKVWPWPEWQDCKHWGEENVSGCSLFPSRIFPTSCCFFKSVTFSEETQFKAVSLFKRLCCVLIQAELGMEEHSLWPVACFFSFFLFFFSLSFCKPEWRWRIPQHGVGFNFSKPSKPPFFPSYPKYIAFYSVSKHGDKVFCTKEQESQNKIWASFGQGTMATVSMLGRFLVQAPFELFLDMRAVL